MASDEPMDSFKHRGRTKEERSLTINKDQFTVKKESAGYWRVIFDNPPLNNFDPYTFAGLNHIMDEAEADGDVRVIVFESANADFFMDHHDVEHRLEVPDVPEAEPFFYKWPDFVTRLIDSPIVTISKVRGRCWAQGFEFALATDMLFASDEKAKFSLIEVAGGSMPGGGGIEWLSELCGRNRALEIVLTSEEYDGKTGELYGFVNRSLPDGELDDFVDNIARRIASFPKRSLLVSKKMINARSKWPSNGELFQSNYILRTIDDWPEADDGLKKIEALVKEHGPEQMELNMPKFLGESA